MKWFLDWIFDRTVCYSGGGGGGGGGRIITDDMKASAEVATKQWNDYQSRFVPFENKYISDTVKRDDTKALQGMVGADIAQKARTSKDPRTANLPSSGALEQAISGGVADARAGALDRKAKGMDTVVSMGRGQQTEALSGLTEQAVTSGVVASAKANAAIKRSTDERGATFGMIGTAIGAAGGIAKNMGGGQGQMYNGVGEGGDIDSGMFDTFGNRVR